jgi:heme-degrading monooxygenase HmoA
MTAQIPAATKEMIDGLRPVLDAIGDAKGFIIHTNGPVPGGWRVIEVWESQPDFEAWFEASVQPAFSAGGPMPSITFDELNEVLTA